MSKTHWVALAQLVLVVGQTIGVIPPETAQWIQYGVDAAFGGTLFHRGLKVAGLVGDGAK